MSSQAQTTCYVIAYDIPNDRLAHQSAQNPVGAWQVDAVFIV